MKQILLSLIGLIISGLAFSQNRIEFNYTKDYESILRQTKDSTSDIYYEKLYQRFEKADTNLSNYEMVALQVGYTDNPKYWPYEDITLEREIWKLNEEKKFKLAKEKLNLLLSNNPFNILGNREMSYVYNKLGDEEKANLYYHKFNLVVSSVLSTGEGTSYESSWFTLSPADGQWIIRLAFEEKVCSMGSGRDSNGNFHDILGIQSEDSEDCTKLFFNIHPASKRMFGPEGLKGLNKGNKKKRKNK